MILFQVFLKKGQEFLMQVSMAMLDLVTIVGDRCGSIYVLPMISFFFFNMEILRFESLKYHSQNLYPDNIICSPENTIFFIWRF